MGLKNKMVQATFDVIGVTALINVGSIALEEVSGFGADFVGMIATATGQAWITPTVGIIAGLSGLAMLDEKYNKGKAVKGMGL
jgi:hypothetical protein